MEDLRAGFGSGIHYSINKGVNRAFEFRGLKAQYIYYLAIGLAVILVMFCVCYISGVPIYLDLILTLGLGVGLFIGVGRLSHRYGAHGLQKRLDYGKLPDAIRPGAGFRLAKPGPASVFYFRGFRR